MRSAKALAVAWVGERTAVTKLNYVVGVHAMLRLCPHAALAILDCLALATGSIDNHRTPAGELGCVVDRVHLPWWQPRGAGVESTDKRGEVAQFGHVLARLTGRRGRRPRAETLRS